MAKKITAVELRFPKPGIGERELDRLIAKAKSDLSVTFSKKERAAIDKAASATGMDVETWAKAELLRAIKLQLFINPNAFAATLDAGQMPAFPAERPTGKNSKVRMEGPKR